MTCIKFEIIRKSFPSSDPCQGWRWHQQRPSGSLLPTNLVKSVSSCHQRLCMWVCVCVCVCVCAREGEIICQWTWMCVRIKVRVFVIILWVCERRNSVCACVRACVCHQWLQDQMIQMVKKCHNEMIRTIIFSHFHLWFMRLTKKLFLISKKYLIINNVICQGYKSSILKITNANLLK